MASYSNSKNETDNDEQNDVQKSNVDFDDLLYSAGGFGKYQLLLFISTFPFYIFGGFVYFGQLFITQVSPNHWCWIPELSNLTNVERRTLAIPPDDYGPFEYSRCFAYDANWTEVMFNGHEKNNSTWEKIPCQHGWEFNKTEIPYPTISSEMGWVCDKDTYPATAQSMFFAGSVVGGVLFGWVADRFGRLPALVFSNLIACVSGIASTFVRNFSEFTICRFIYGISSDTLTTMAYLIILEYVAPKYRAFVANLPFALFYAPLLIVLPWIAVASGDWKIFNLVTNIPIGLALLSPFFIPESPRWLLSKGYVEKVIEGIFTIAKSNKKEVTAIQVERFKQSVDAEKKENVNMFDLLKRPILRRTYICICLVYISSVLVFDALVRIIQHLKFDFFISFSLISLTELPSLVISAFILDWLGRRRMIAITMSVCCVFSILIAFVGGGLPSVICAIVARFVVNMGLGTAGQWTAELLPTPVRGTGISLQHIIGFLVVILSPYIVYLERYLYWFPLVFVGIIAGFCAVLAQTLPETAGKDLPQTFGDAEDLVRSQNTLKLFKSKKVKESNRQENKAYS